jgi:hypothetical protein
MIGAEPSPADYEREVAALSGQGWNKLRNKTEDHTGLSATVLEEERASWKTLFDKVNKIYVAAGSHRISTNSLILY